MPSFILVSMHPNCLLTSEYSLVQPPSSTHFHCSLCLTNTYFIVEMCQAFLCVALPCNIKVQFCTQKFVWLFSWSSRRKAIQTGISIQCGKGIYMVSRVSRRCRCHWRQVWQGRIQSPGNTGALTQMTEDEDLK